MSDGLDEQEAGKGKLLPAWSGQTKFFPQPRGTSRPTMMAVSLIAIAVLTAGAYAATPTPLDQAHVDALIADCEVQQKADACTELLTARLPFKKQQIASIYALRGSARQSAGDLKGALEDYDQALRVEPKLPQVYLTRGALYLNGGEPQKAADDFGRFINASPGASEGYYNRGLAFRALNRCDRAVSDFQQTLKLDERFAEAAYQKGVCEHALSQLEQAMASYDLALSIRPDFVDALVNRGAAGLKLGRAVKAEQDFKEALSLNPKNLLVSYNLGRVYVDLGRLDDAIEQFSQTLLIEPAHRLALYNRGIAYFEQKKGEQALADLDAVIRMSEANASQLNGSPTGINYDLSDFSSQNGVQASEAALASAYLKRGMLYHLNGSFDLAIADYDKAAKFNPDLKDTALLRGKAQRLEKLTW
ncbi:tetratricopeptide repeat protein [Mesorhizobium sp.]|uniref:tetratricopeptide repeat protein n=1 Tax=Mesorhizobium sp. TaxID=1871066 RepID=UPI000FE8141B|nr:tetratricopeptide repeat protein [Mesorhizobium sp.]RWK76776.1 MAG: tetratricopeptide repeat protein [Mesorhizobium sp.]RWP80334.1 MAG: tetratricopeptide repeat protein [Mesorhizobium sp.]